MRQESFRQERAWRQQQPQSHVGPRPIFPRRNWGKVPDSPDHCCYPNYAYGPAYSQYPRPVAVSPNCQV